MEKTVCEFFAGVGGFRCGVNYSDTSNRGFSPFFLKEIVFFYFNFKNKPYYLCN